jgi:hypothetical protein
MAQATIVALLRHTIGLKPDAIGAETIARAIRQRMGQCGTSDMQTYLKRLQASERELHALIDEVIVPETWFFRDQMPFAYLGRYVMAEWLPIYQHAVLRVLSVACSTGEEPYSLAMALLDTGLASAALSHRCGGHQPQSLALGAGCCVRQPFLSRGRPGVSGALFRAQQRGVSDLRARPSYGHVYA